MKTPFRASIAGSALALLSLSTPTAAAENNLAEPIENLTVQASRLDQASHEMGTSVSVITGEQLQQLGYDFVFDAIAAAPGVTVNQNGTFGGSATVRIRGASSEQTLVLVDGVAVNDPSSPGGGFNFARLDPENVERIEILKGPQSTLWGSDAIGGVVSITTRQPEDGFSGNVFFEHGSFNTSRGGAEVTAGGERGDFRLGVQRTESDGISKADEDNGNSEEDSYEGTTVNLQGNLRLPNDAYLSLSVINTEAESEFDSSTSGAQGNVGDGDELSDTEELNGQISLHVPALDGRLQNTLTVGYTDIERENFSDGVSSFSTEGERKLYRYQGKLQVNERHRFGFGAEREENETVASDSEIDGIYGLYEWRPSDKLTLTFGLRTDDIDGFDRQTTGRFAAAYQATEQITLRGSWGEGFKAPTIFQTTFFCCGATAPNADLQPEESDAYDFGIDWRSVDGRGNVGLTYFTQDFTNLITFSFPAGGYENIAQAETEGVELDLGYQLTQWLRMDASYAWIDAEDDAGQQLVRVPEHSADLQLSIRPNERLNVNLLMRYNGEEADRNGEVASWTRVDVSANYRISDQLSAFMRVENLLEEDYQQILGYGTPDLAVFGGVRLSF